MYLEDRGTLPTCTQKGKLIAQKGRIILSRFFSLQVSRTATSCEHFSGELSAQHIQRMSMWSKSCRNVIGAKVGLNSGPLISIFKFERVAYPAAFASGHKSSSEFL